MEPEHQPDRLRLGARYVQLPMLSVMKPFSLPRVDALALSNKKLLS
ncbi:hypothetical protein [Streptomyces sp. DH10]|nr:hypothetical protein [Streptomyces sp. DH10]MDG9708363.1 hypothetical protein [Streptomyces sp. DH10]